MLSPLIAGRVQAIDSLWFIGDEIADWSFIPYYKHIKPTDDKTTYAADHYDLEDFTATKFSSSLHNILSQLLSLLAKAINTNTLLPKGIVFVLDADVIQQIGLAKDLAVEGYKKILKFLLREVQRMIQFYKHKLPRRSKAEYCPQVLWILPPQHKYFSNNILRRAFANALEEIVERFPLMCALKLKKVWSE